MIHLLWLVPLAALMSRIAWLCDRQTDRERDEIEKRTGYRPRTPSMWSHRL
jgi:4-hydroxybenzoate polyprenyltransferase